MLNSIIFPLTLCFFTYSWIDGAKKTPFIPYIKENTITLSTKQCSYSAYHNGKFLSTCTCIFRKFTCLCIYVKAYWPGTNPEIFQEGTEEKIWVEMKRARTMNGKIGPVNLSKYENGWASLKEYFWRSWSYLFQKDCMLIHVINIYTQKNQPLLQVNENTSSLFLSVFALFHDIFLKIIKGGCNPPTSSTPRSYSIHQHRIHNIQISYKSK